MARCLRIMLERLIEYLCRLQAIPTVLLLTVDNPHRHISSSLFFPHSRATSQYTVNSPPEDGIAAFAIDATPGGALLSLAGTNATGAGRCAEPRGQLGHTWSSLADHACAVVSSQHCVDIFGQPWLSLCGHWALVHRAVGDFAMCCSQREP